MQYNPDFFAISLNCTGLRTSKTQLQMTLDKIEGCLGSRPQALLLQECFMTRLEMLSLKIEGYQPVAATEGVKEMRQRRGSVILVDYFTNVQPLKERTTKGVELIGVKVVGSTTRTFDKPFELWTVYSGPTRKEAIKCKGLIKSLNEQRENRVLIAGDFNSDILPDGTQANRVLKLELERLEEEGQARILNDYCETTTINGSVIDLAVTLGDWDAGFVQPIDWHVGSTHYPICIGVTTGESKARRVEYENTLRYTQNDKAAARLKTELASIKREIQEHTGDTLIQAIFDAFKETSLDHTPKKIRKQQKHWVNAEIKALFAEKQRLLTVSGRSSGFKEVDERLKEAISNAKNESFQEFANGLDHRNQNSNVYRVMRSIGSRRPSRVAELAIIGKDGKVATNLKQKTNLLSRRYQVPLGYHPKRDPARKMALKRNKAKSEKENPRGVDHEPFSAAEVRIAREDMSNNKAPGLSRLRKEDLEMGGEEMDALIKELADKIAISGEWPIAQKKGVICPFPKDFDAMGAIEEDKTRPIALLETCDKWVQRMFYNRIIKHVEYNEVQAGYCLSTDHHTTLVTDFVMNNQNDDAYCLAVFTDISKAFDSVPFDELAEVIWASSIQPAYKWVLVSFVEDRQFRVEIRDANGNVAASEWRKMLYGTPQGTVLGPLLWNMFFDPLLDKLTRQQTSTRVMEEVKELDTAFADDLTLLAKSENPKQCEQILEQKLKIFKDFLDERGMEAASHKLKIMCLDPKKRGYSPQVHLNEQLIEEVSVHKFLGIYYDKHMTFTDHWKMVVTSVASRTKTLTMLRGVSWGPTQQTARILHRSYVESRIRYGMLAWYPFLKDWQKKQLEVYLDLLEL